MTSTKVAVTVPPIDRLLSVPDVVFLILGHLTDPRDILSVCLTSKYFSDAAWPHLFRDINLPQISVRARRKNNPAFHQRYHEQLSKYTRTLRIDGRRVSGETIDSIEPIHRQYRHQEESLRELKTKIDRLFGGLELTLQRVPRLRAISSHRLPRCLDFLILVQKYCPDIESVRIDPLMMDFLDPFWDRASSGFINDSYSLVDLTSLAPTVSDIWNWHLFPLANGVNMKIAPSLPLVFNFPMLRHLSLAGVRMMPLTGRGFFVDNIVSLLVGSPNLQALCLTGFAERSHEPYGPSTYDDEAFSPWPSGEQERDLVELSFQQSYPDGSWAPLPDHKIFSDVLESICRVYRQSGANPLKLRRLRLDTAAEASNLNQVPISPQDHYLACLTDLSCLEELEFVHSDRETTSNGLPTTHANRLSLGYEPRSLFLWPDTIRLITGGHLPRLQKLTIPWVEGLSWTMLADFIARKLPTSLVISFFQNPSQIDRRNGAAAVADLPIDYFPQSFFGGLVLNCVHWSLTQRPSWPVGDAEDPTQPRLCSLLHRTRSLKVRMWMLWGPRFHLSEQEHSRSFISLLDRAIFLGLLPKAPELREIWIYDLKGEILKALPTVDAEGDAKKSYHYLAMTLAEMYGKLTYVRVDDMAWRVYRPSPGENHVYLPQQSPELLPISQEVVDQELPWAFDNSWPGL